MDTSQTTTHAWRRIAPILIVSAFYFGMLVYPVLRILGLAFPSWQPGTLELVAIMVGPLAGRLAHELAPSRFTRWLSGSPGQAGKLNPRGVERRQGEFTCS